jgi:hypothetical protein
MLKLRRKKLTGWFSEEVPIIRFNDGLLWRIITFMVSKYKVNLGGGIRYKKTMEDHNFMHDCSVCCWNISDCFIY